MLKFNMIPEITKQTTKGGHTMTEQVNCQYCGQDIEIAEDTICHCGVELSTTMSLREHVRSLEAGIIALRIQQGKAVEELCRRERMKNMKRDGCHVSNVAFWQNVHGKPGWASRPKSAPARRSIDMAQFD
jgi:hypothetical protein